MSQLITWTVAGGSLVFLIGLISAIGSRRRRKPKPRVQLLMRVQGEESTGKGTPYAGAMSMAAGGGNNGEENFAAVGNHSR